jgi:hypothetical protein
VHLPSETAIPIEHRSLEAISNDDRIASAHLEADDDVHLSGTLASSEEAMLRLTSTVEDHDLIEPGVRHDDALSRKHPNVEYAVQCNVIRSALAMSAGGICEISGSDHDLRW